MKNHIFLSIVIISLALCTFAVKPGNVSAYTQPLVTNSGITYPISLATGKDATGRLVFEDEDFLEYVTTATFEKGKYSGCLWDLDEDGSLSQEECETVRILSPAGNTEITSLRGVEAFPKLRELYASHTNITALDLSNNPRLQIINCQETPLMSLDVSACPLLKELKISSCQLACLDLSSATSLEFLTCEYQQRDAGEYKEDDLYKVCLADLDGGVDLSKVSEVEIDGAEGDGIHSGYDPDTGIVYCSDEIQEISYVYTFDFGGASGDSVDQELNVTLQLTTGIRQAYETSGGSFVMPTFVDEGASDEEPDTPSRDGYIFTGWYEDESCYTLHTFGSTQYTNSVLYAGWEVDTRVEETTDTQTTEKETKEYRLQFEAVITDAQKASLEYMPGSEDDLVFTWDQADIPDQLSTPRLPGYQFCGWYTAKTGGTMVTDEMTYGEIYTSQFSTVQDGQVPTLYARFALTQYTICYDENGGSAVSDRYGLTWGSQNLLPTKKTKKKGYIFAGWKWDEKKVTKKTKLNNSDYAYANSITLKAIWHKKYEKKGTKFKRYGCVYKVIKSNKKGNRVKLIKIRRKKVTIRNKVFYNGKFFKLKSIRKNALKNASKVRLKVPKKQKKKYIKMIRRAGARKSAYKTRKRGKSK